MSSEEADVPPNSSPPVYLPLSIITKKNRGPMVIKFVPYPFAMG